MRYVGNKAGWLTQTAAAIMDGGSKPPSVASLITTVPNKLGTHIHDGHVTATENGIKLKGMKDRDHLKAGYEIWIEGTVKALRDAGLVGGDDSSLVWLAESNEDHKVEFAGKTITVYGVESRKSNRDRYMLGATPEPVVEHEGFEAFASSKGLGHDGRVLRGDIDPLNLIVQTRNNGKDFFNEHRFEIHPLAMAIPPMTEFEQVAMRADVENNGIKVPLITYVDANDLTPRGKPKLKILDGRHRAYFASVLGKPVKLEEFQGTEDEARALVDSLNLRRRHLTRQQRAFSAMLLYYDQAKDEAERNKGGRPRKGSEKPRTESSEVFDGDSSAHDRRTYMRVYHLAGGEMSGFTPNDARVMAKVMTAPKTAARIQSGEIRNTEKIRRLVREETTNEPVRIEAGENVSKLKSLWEHLGSARSSLKSAVKAMDNGIDPTQDDKLSYQQIFDRLKEIHFLTSKLENGVEQDRMHKKPSLSSIVKSG